MKIMKASINHWHCAAKTVIIAMTAVVFTACSTDSEDNATRVYPVVCPIEPEQPMLKTRSNVDDATYDRLATFFMMAFDDARKTGGDGRRIGFFGQLTDEIEACYLITSVEDFKAVYYGDRMLPEVDFERYSVLVGRSYSTDSRESLGNYTYNLVDEGDHYRLPVNILRNVNPSLIYTQEIGDLFYWDVFPKVESKPVLMERRVVEKVIDEDQSAQAAGMLQLRGSNWVLTGYTDRDSVTHQVGSGWGDSRYTISFLADGTMQGKIGANSIGAHYHLSPWKACLASGDGLRFVGWFALTDGFTTSVWEIGADATDAYFGSHLWEMEFFDVDEYDLTLSDSRGQKFSFRDASLK